MLQNLLSALVVIGALRVKPLTPQNIYFIASNWLNKIMRQENGDYGKCSKILNTLK